MGAPNMHQHTIFAIVPLMAMVVATAAYGSPQGLQGRWQCAVGDERVNLEVASADRLRFGDEDMRYRVSGDRILIEQHNQVRPHAYQLRGNTLNIVSPEGYFIACRRSSALPDPAARGVLTSPSGNPAQHPTGNSNAALVGMYCGFAGTSNASGATSRVTRVQFDGRGNFALSTEGSFSATTGSGVSTSGDRGRYVLAHAAPGATVAVRWQSGEDDEATVTEVRGGRVAEFRYGKQVFSPGLCNF
jgi:hypothetical protein